MIDYRNAPEPGCSGGSRSRGLFVDRRSLTTLQRVIQTASIIAWFGTSLSAMVYVSGLSEKRLDQARSSSAMASLWFQPNGWIETTFLVPIMLGLIVLVLNLRLISKATILALLIATLIGGSATAMRAYVMVMDDQVLIHPALPWHPDIRFALAGATVTARGCSLWHSKNSTHHEIIFKVRGGPGAGQTVDLGEAAGRDLGAWLAVMRDYDDGYLPLPLGAGANAAHDANCLQYWLGQLDRQQQAEFTHLLS